MIAVDTNILVYAHVATLPQHPQAFERLRELAEGQARWALPVFCLGEFLRLITHPRVFEPAWPARDAKEAVERLLDSPSIVLLSPGPEFPKLLLEAMVEGGATGNLVFDAQVVALCREAGVTTLLTEDRDFARFRGLRTIRL